ncbi:MAG: helix-turn-helix transcriptional regulator [Clostridia bacterium]|nr:helix-turn-helix transcriptional regulator [Clostridia bacterium]
MKARTVMTLGQKIRSLRKERGLTQAALCGEHMTRNMLSQIENDVATPSLQTVCFLAKQLTVPVGYLLDDGADALVYRKAGLIDQIRAHYASGRWQDCIDDCKQLSDFDDELALLLADCYLQEGLTAFYKGHLESAAHLIDTCLRFTARTCYPKDAIRERADALLTIIRSLRDGLTDDPSLCVAASRADYGEEYLYHTLLQLIDRGKSDLAAQLFDSVRLTSPRYRKHINARLAQAAYNHQRAASLLREVLEESASNADARFLLRLYADLENCAKAVSDYEGAYHAAVAKNELIAKFHL